MSVLDAWPEPLSFKFVDYQCNVPCKGRETLRESLLIALFSNCFGHGCLLAIVCRGLISKKAARRPVAPPLLGANSSVQAVDGGARRCGLDQRKSHRLYFSLPERSRCLSFENAIHVQRETYLAPQILFFD